MDWQECIKEKIVKNINEDRNKINSIKHIAQLKIESANYLPENHFITKITLLYDALRELLESKALELGYKVYNHECYGAFLKEILKKSVEADNFNNLRKIINGINYYGKKVDLEESEYLIKNLKKLIEIFK